MVWPFKSRLARAQEAYQLKMIGARQRLLESTVQYWDTFVDPRDAYTFDDDGSLGIPVGYVGKEPMEGKALVRNEAELRQLRERTRALAAENEFAINGHENRISYIVGTGLTYSFEQGEIPVSEETQKAAQAWLDEVLDLNDWASREQEAVRRGDRDGEVFLRVFHPIVEQGERQLPIFRFVEPEDVSQPQHLVHVPSTSWGIRTDPSDVEDVLSYFVNGNEVPAEEIIHVKLNVDRNQKRGLPTFAPVRKNLLRAEKLLRNMSAVAQLQAAIALIREHEGFGKDDVETFRDGQDDFQVSETVTGKTRHFQQIGPGTIIDAPAGTKYNFPVAGVAAEKFVVVLQAELRAVAARLVMPEFMFTSDASNANYSSTMVSEGPAVKMFQRMQSLWREAFIALLWSALENAVAMGFMPAEALNLDLNASLPSLTVRDEEKEGKTLGRENEAGVLSKRTWAEIRGYDFDREQDRIDEETEHAMERMPAFPMPSEEDDQGEEGEGEGEGEDEE